MTARKSAPTSKSRRGSLSATALWNWARKHAKRHEDAGRGTRYPTMRDATKRFRCTLDDIEGITGDDVEGQDDYYLGIATAIGVPGGGAIGNIEPRGEQLVEAY